MISLTLSRFSRNILFNLNMSATAALECIKQNAELTERTIVELKTELEAVSAHYNNVQAEQLRKENKALTIAIEAAKKQLIQLETKNGVKQILVPNQRAAVVEYCSAESQPKTGKNVVQESAAVKPKKEKKVKEPKEKPQPADELPVDVGRLDLRVAKIEEVQRHPDADSLYLLKINCGEEKPRTVCSGLVKFVPMEALQNKDVMLLCNLKPVKMRGVTSEAMVMCASTPAAVEVLSPPPNCAPGEAVHCEGYTRNPDPVMNPKKKIFETVAPDLSTNSELKACYKGVPFTVPGKGYVVAATLKNCQVK